MLSSSIDHSLHRFLDQKLRHRRQEGTLRTLRTLPTPRPPPTLRRPPVLASNLNNSLVDFASNDYLGFARNEALRRRLLDRCAQITQWGATGSRLLSGNGQEVMELERWLADYWRADAALIFNSGFDLNLGLLATLPQAGEVIFMDQHLHASARLGARLSRASRLIFRHNDLEHLERRLAAHRGAVGRYIAVESVYSMDGDLSPLGELVRLAHDYKARLVVDEAHAVGVLGPRGLGLVAQLGLEKDIFARTCTFGKALGATGAVLLGEEALIEAMVNFCPTFIYTTALSLPNILAIGESMRALQNQDCGGRELAKLQDNIKLFNQLLNLGDHLGDHPSAIYSIPMGEVKKSQQAANQLRRRGWGVSSIVPPTVPQGTERLRLCLHSFNEERDIKELACELRGKGKERGDERGEGRA